MATYRLFPTTDGPSSPVSWGGSFLAGVLFQVTTGGVWFDGYWWWVCETGQSAAAQKFALWVVYADGTGTLIPAATVTSAALTAGQGRHTASYPAAARYRRLLQRLHRFHRQLSGYE